MAESKAKKAAEAAAQAPQPPTEKPASSQPREYAVFREVPASELSTAELGDLKVLVPLGVVAAKTAKEARRTIAKEKLNEDELRSEGGVPLRAITKSAASAGRGIAKLKVEPTWDD